MQPLEIEDFSGGVTDYYLNAEPNKLRICDNFTLVPHQGVAKPYTRPGSRLYDGQIPAGAQRIATMFNWKGYLFAQSGPELYKSGGGGWTTITGPTGTNAFDEATTASVFTFSHWNYHTLFAYSNRRPPMMIYYDNSGTVQLRTAGLHKPPATFTTGAVGGESRLYVVVYKYTYVTQDTVTFVMRSSPSNPVVATSALPVTLAGIATFTTDYSDDNYDIVNVKKEVYRTINGGTDFYLVTELSYNTAGYVDNLSDNALQQNEPLYTTGGVLPNDKPPRCRLVHIFGDTAYFADVQENSGNAKLNYRVVQSVPGIVSAAPEANFVEVDDQIIGMSSTKSNLVLCCQGSVYRVDGSFDETGQGGMVAERISDTASCCSPQGVVQALDGLFWAGYDGIYYTDGFRVQKLNRDYDQTYKEFVTVSGLSSGSKQQRIQGKYDKKQNRIFWTIQHESLDDVDKVYILDLNYGVRENATAYTWSGLSSFSPTAICFDFVGNFLRADRRGFVFQHDPLLHVDPKIDLTIVDPTNWAAQTIFYRLRTVAYDFGTSFVRKWVPGITLTAESTTNLSLAIVGINDDGKTSGDLKPIRYRGKVVYGDPDIYWGDDQIPWNKEGLITEKRRMPASGGLRCTFKQLEFSNAYVVIITSDLVGTADINAALKTVTLTAALTTDWPTNSVDYYISFEADDYQKDFLVTARTDDVLTFADPDNHSMTMIGSKWELRGYPKNEIFNLVNYSIPYMLFGETQEVFNKVDTGEISE